MPRTHSPPLMLGPYDNSIIFRPSSMAEVVHKPTLKTISVSPCLRVLRVNRPEATTPLALHGRTLHGRNKLRPSRRSPPPTGRDAIYCVHIPSAYEVPALPCRLGTQCTRAALGTWRPNGLDTCQAGGSRSRATVYRGLRPVNTEHAEARGHGEWF